MSGRLRVALVVAALVLAAGLAYFATRGATWESKAQLILAPQGSDAAEDSVLLGSFDRSGTTATYVELIESSDVLDLAGDPDTSIEARSVPDSRVIDVTATGSWATVESDLDAVLRAAKQRGLQLSDPWRLQVLTTPSSRTTGGPSDVALLLAVLALAGVAGLATFVLVGALSRLTAEPGVRPPPASPDGDRIVLPTRARVTAPRRAAPAAHPTGRERGS
jgi:hypothetical protein